jgi:DNA repair ATPase RecN
MSSPSNEMREFAHRHSIRVIDTNKRAYKHTRQATQMFRFDDDYNKFLSENLTFETETLYTVEISESEFQRLAEFEKRVFNNMAEKGHFNLFETLMEQKELESRLRNNFPAVKKAYEQYSLMLKLAQSGEL